MSSTLIVRDFVSVTSALCVPSESDGVAAAVFSSDGLRPVCDSVTRNVVEVDTSSVIDFAEAVG